MAKEKKGMMFVLSSPSGAGKTTLTKKIAKNNSNFIISVSHTTRKPRPNEVNGRDYHFVSGEEFNKLVKSNSFFEHANIFDNKYGTLKKPVEEFSSQGKNVLFDIDWQGADQIKNKKLDYKLITFFILPPSKEVLFERLSNRHMGDRTMVEERMNQFSHDVLHWINYDYVVINDTLNNCFSKIINLIDAELKNGSKDYDKDFIRKHVEKLTV